MMPELILAGGGDAEDSRPLDEVLARRVPTGGALLYLPIALDPREHSYTSCHEWLRSVFAPLGLDNIVMWADISGKGDADLDAFVGVYIGGGNTFTLLHALRVARFLTPLRRFLAHGGIVYGGSAGAIILGKDIMTAADADPNEVGLRDSSGLDLLDGYSVWCHYQPGDDGRIADYIRRHTSPVIALSERAGIYIRGRRAQGAGRLATGPATARSGWRRRPARRRSGRPLACQTRQSRPRSHQR